MKSLLSCFSLASALVAAPLALAQGPPVAPPPPPPQPTTIFSFFGIPQGIQKLKDQHINKNGNNPQRERQPKLKRIGDPANLASHNPAIKKAAEVKTEEDLAPQKIKAIKYLASIGCGCYNRDGGITAALLAAMDDCTEEVRLAAVNAIIDAACADVCVYCKQKTCCTPAIAKRLEKMAFEQDEKGCWFEPSARVRAAAAEAANFCSVKLEAHGDTPEVPRSETPTPEVPAIDGTGIPRPSRPAASRLVPKHPEHAKQPSTGRTTQVEPTSQIDAAQLAQGVAENELRSAVATLNSPAVDFSTAWQVTATPRGVSAAQPTPAQAATNATSNQAPLVAQDKALFDNPPAPERRSVLVPRTTSPEPTVAVRESAVESTPNHSPVPTRVVATKRVVTKRPAHVASSEPERTLAVKETPAPVEQPATEGSAGQGLVRFRSTATAAPLRVPAAKATSASENSHSPGIRYLDDSVRLSEASTDERRF